MKIFYFQRVKEIKELNSTINLLSKANKSMTEELKASQQELDILNKAFNTLKKDKTSITRKFHNCKKENEELKNKIADLMSDRYLKVKVPAGRKPKTMTMKTKEPSKQSQVRKILQEKNENI